MEARARRELQRRTRAAATGLALLAIPSIVFVVAPVFLLLAAATQWALGRRLESRGILVPASLISSSGKPARFKDAAEAWASEQNVLQGFHDEGVGAALGFAHQLVLWLGRLVPFVIVHYTFESRGRRYRVGKYMFTEERFLADDSGCSWALVDPDYPRFNHWIVSSRQN